MEEAFGELAEIALETLYRALAVAVHVKVLGTHVEGAVLFDRRDVGLGGTLYISEVFVHSVLAHIYILHGAEGVACLVGAGIVGQQLVEDIECLVVAVGIVVDETHVEQCRLHQTVLRVTGAEVVEVEQSHLVVVANQIGVAYLEERFGCQRRLVVALENLVQIGELLMIFAHGSVAKGFLIGGIVGIGILSLYHTVVVLDGFGVFAVEIAAVSQPVVHIVDLMLVDGFVGQSEENLKVVGGIGNVVAFHAQVAVRIERLTVVGRSGGVAAKHKAVERLAGSIVVAHTVTRLGIQIVGIGGVLGQGIDFGCLLEIAGGVFHVARVEHLDTPVDDDTLVGLVHERGAVGNLLDKGEGILVVARGEVERAEDLLHLGLVDTLGILGQVILERTDRLVIRIGVQLIRQLGVVEQRILLYLGVIVHLRGLEEHAAGIVLAA